ncbi:alpha/beta fold hydrolase [Dankookia rubra]|uniref:alpha/beta fold hydrolase n=1 Tax=Dankookia rubra TaxID=1442381 RepID=UPI00140B1F56|nr:alpha/beta fold hydrolase [Dankookia rubra]
MANILLIHGAYQGGWIWTRVAARLRAAGHLVLAPSLDGCAERAHAIRPRITTESQAEELASLLFHEDWRDAVVAGTSTGGMVMCKLAELAPERIGRLVFADALALQDGEKLPDIVARPTAVNTELTSGPSRADAEGRLFAELDAGTRAWTLERICQHPILPMTAPVVLPRFWSMPWQASVVWCRRSQNPPVAHQRRLQQALRAAWHELDTGHYPMLSEPAALAGLIAE